MADERKVQLGVTVDATGAKTGFDQVKQEAKSMAKSVSDSGAQAGKAIDGIGNGGNATAQKVDAATKSMIQSIQRTTAAMEAGSRTSSKYYETLAAQRGVDVSALKPYLAQLDAVSAKQTDTGISAAQMSAALRGLPAQFSDIASSLASGQKPMTVMMQQGGQLKDMFGGIGPAARAMGGYIVGLINPLTVAAAAVGGLAYASYQGSQEFEAYNRALILTGNAAGTTADKLAGMADRLSKASGITKGAAAEALTEFASTGQVAASQFEKFTATAVRLQQQAGVAVKDTVKQFVDLGKDPVAASVKLNETTNYLTKSIYDQIRALSEQGKNAEAASVAQNAYNDALNQRIPKLVDNLGLVERAWKRIVDAMKGAVDSALDIGRKADPADTVQKALEASYGRLEKLRKLGNGKDTLIAIAEEQKRAAALAKEAESLALVTRQKEKDAAADAERAKQLAAYNKWQDAQDKYLPRQAQMIRDLERAKNEAKAAGISEDSQDFKARIEGIKREYSDLLNVGLEALRGQQAVQREMLAGDLASLESQHKQMLIGDEQYLVRKQDLQLKGLEMDRALAQKGADIAAGKKDLAERERYLGDLKKLEAQRKNIIKSTQDEISGIILAKNKTLVEQADKWRAATVNDRALMEEEIALFGKSAEAQKIVTEQIKVDADARQFLADMQKKGQSLSVRQIDNLLAEAEARKENIAAIMGERQARAGAEQLRQENLKFAAESIVDEQARAEALLKIDADIWRERIAMAGEGTEAQKKLQEQFDQWYAKRQMAPVLDRWKNIIGNLDNDFREGFRDMLSNGQDAWKSFSKSLRNTLKTSLADALYQTFIKKYVVQIVAGLAGVISGPSIAGALDGSGAAGGGGGLGSTASLFSAGKSMWEGFSTGFETFGAKVGTQLMSAGDFLGADSLVEFGRGMTGTVGESAAMSAGGSLTAAMSAYAPMAVVAVASYLGARAIAGDYRVEGIGGALNWAGLGGGLINRAFGMGERETQRFGIEGDFAAGGFSGRNFADWHQDGGWFRSDDGGTDYSQLDPTLGKIFSSSISALKSQTADMAKSLGLSSDAISDYSKHIRLELTNDKAKNEKIIADMFSSIGDELASKVGDFTSFAKEGESAAVTMQRLATSLTTANAWLARLRENLLQVSLVGADSASKLADAFGGIENLNNASAAFYQTYYSEAERAADSTAAMGKALAEVGIAMPKTKDELREMAASLDLNTEAGRKAYAVLLSIAPEFANVAEVTSRLAKEAASNLLAAYTGNGNLVPVLGATQQASAVLSEQMDMLRDNARNATIDVSGLGSALAHVDTETFIDTVSLVFESLGNRIKAVIGSIADERSATRDAALKIVNPSVMSKEEILGQISGINTTLPGNAELVSTYNALNASYSAVATAQASLKPVQSLQQTLDDAKAKVEAANAAQAALDAAAVTIYQHAGYQGASQTVGVGKSGVSGIGNDELSSIRVAEGYIARLFEHGDFNGRSVSYTSDASSVGTFNDKTSSIIVERLSGYVLPAVTQANAALAAAQAAMDSSGKTLAEAQAAYNSAVAQQGAAAEQAKKAQVAYADALQNFSIDAGKSVSKLSRLREETLRYYEAQKQLADLMTNSATGLRKSLSDYRYSQLSPEEQFAALRSQFSSAYSMALSTDGDVLAGYADKLNSLINPLLEKANEVYGGGADYNALVSSVFASAQNIAGRLDALTPANYAEDSLQMLGQIDATLAALDEASRSADKLIVDAINASRDQTVGGLRAVVAALTGQPVPAFATGGWHDGGLRIVGEEGPEIEATGPARYYSATQTRALLAGGGNDELVAEIRALRQDNADMRAELRAIATHSSKTARQLERFEIDGLTVKTDADTPLKTEAV